MSLNYLQTPSVSSNVFIINLIDDNNGVISGDKTAEQIYNAFCSGKKIIYNLQIEHYPILRTLDISQLMGVQSRIDNENNYFSTAIGVAGFDSATSERGANGMVTLYFVGNAQDYGGFSQYNIICVDLTNYLIS